MPTLIKIGNIKIQVYANDHNPPHFHVVTAEFEALVRIDTLEIIEGSLPRRALEVALDWARENKETIRNEWSRING